MKQLRQRLDERLLKTEPSSHCAQGDHDLNPNWRPATDGKGGVLKDAAVLIPIVDYGTEYRVLFTQRSENLPSHAGQISFPGGRVDAVDRDATDAALRETEEEIGLARNFISIAGFLENYRTGTGYRVVPVVGVVERGFELTINEAEVSEVFDAPLDFFMDPTNHNTHSMEWQGRMRQYYAMPYEGRYIWGATAGILKLLYDKLSPL